MTPEDDLKTSLMGSLFHTKSSRLTLLNMFSFTIYLEVSQRVLRLIPFNKKAAYSLSHSQKANITKDDTHYHRSESEKQEVSMTCSHS